MAVASSVLINLEANITKFVTEMQKASKSLEGTEKSIKKLGESGKSVDNLNKQISSLSTTIKAIGKLTVLAGTVYGIARSFDAFARAAGEAERSQRKLEFAVEAMGYNVKAVLPALNDWVNTMVKTTKLSDEETKDALQQMALYTNNLSDAQRGVKIALDLSARSGIEFNSAMQLVGQAMNGNLERLARYIPQLRNLDDKLGKNATQAEKWNYFMTLYHKNMEGAAKGELNDYSIQVKKLSDEWGEFKEAAGAFIIGPAKAILNFLTVGAQGARAFADEVKRAADELRGLSARSIDKEILDLQTKREGMLRRGGGGLLGSLFGYEREEDIRKVTIEIERLKKERDSLFEVSYKASTAKGDGKDSTGTDAMKGKIVDPYKDWDMKPFKLYAELMDKEDRERIERTKRISEMLAQEAEDQYEQIQENLGYERYYRDEKARLYDDMISAEDKFYTAQREQIEASVEFEKYFRDESIRLKNEMIEADVKMASDIAERNKEKFGPLVDFANQIGDTFVNVFANMADSTKSFSDRVKDTFKSLADSVIAEISRMMMQWMLFGSIQGMGGFSKGSPVGGLLGLLGVKAFASGGIVTQPTMAMIGESGPEAVVPLNSKSMGGGDTYIYISAVDTQSFNDAIRRNPGSILKVIHKNDRENMYARP